MIACGKSGQKKGVQVVMFCGLNKKSKKRWRGGGEFLGKGKEGCLRCLNLRLVFRATTNDREMVEKWSKSARFPKLYHEHIYCSIQICQVMRKSNSRRALLLHDRSKLCLPLHVSCGFLRRWSSCGKGSFDIFHGHFP
jgi:hypothetical protein